MRHLDFGVGFYVTKIKSQSRIWAKRKSIIENTKMFYVNIYELNKKYTDCKYLLFAKANEEWLDFVCACRDGKTIYKRYDIIEGPVADDKVYTVVENYRKNIWDKKRALEELKFYKISNQICFINQKILDKNLIYKRCENGKN